MVIIRKIKKLKKLREISILNTLKFNFHYFNLKTAIKLPVIVSKNVYLHTLEGSVNLRQIRTGIIELGFGDVGIFDKKYDKGIWENKGEIIFNGKANIGHGSKISNSSILEFGDNFIITSKSEIICFHKIKFGDNCLLSWDNLIMDTDFHKIYNNKNKLINEDESILIDDNVWIGCRSVILKGSHIPKGSIVGANSTITKNFYGETNILIGGNNTVLKNDIRWEA